MAQEIQTEIELDASPEQVWNLLGDIAGYRRWSKIFRFLPVDARPGGRALLWAKLAGPLSAPIPVRFETIEAGREIRWHGGNPRVGYGSHYLKLEALDGGRTRLIHGESFEGPVVELGWPLLGGALPGAYHAFNREVARQLA